jgi:hypothetical protein
MRFQLLPDHSGQIGARPAGTREERMGTGNRRHAALHDFGEVRGVLRPAQYDDGLHHGERVLGSMIDFLHEQAQAGLRLFALGHQVRSHADDQPPTASVEAYRC